MIILVVDDSRIMRNIIKNTMSRNPKYAHAVFLEAPDGREAHRLIEAQQIDLLLVDWNMPALNGLDLVKKLRAAPGYANKMPIIMITSESAKYSVIEAVKAGVNDYLIKPVSEKLLMEKLERIGF